MINNKMQVIYVYQVFMDMCVRLVHHHLRVPNDKIRYDKNGPKIELSSNY